MSEHYDESRKQEAQQMRPAHNRMYKQLWGEDITIHSFESDRKYPAHDEDKTINEIHDIVGADTLMLVDSKTGTKPIFIEEKSRTYKKEKLSKPYYNGPKDEDLALTLKYNQKDNQPKYQKHIDTVDKIGFIPSVLSYIVYDSDRMEALRGFLIDYKKLLRVRDNLDTTVQEYKRYGKVQNVTEYIPQPELEPVTIKKVLNP